MEPQERLTKIDGTMLAEAFPVEHRDQGLPAGMAVAALLSERQWTERFSVKVNQQNVVLPFRLHFVGNDLPMNSRDEAWLFARALQTRSNDGYERQRAARDLLAGFEAWCAPFIIALIGEYLIEIMDDVAAGLTPEVIGGLAEFIAQNGAYWETTKRRVVSYWNAYYRWGRASETRQVYAKSDYVGFRLVDCLERAAYGSR
jgi:hypothetical protein